jgi:hypothetical protein
LNRCFLFVFHCDALLLSLSSPSPGKPLSSLRIDVPKRLGCGFSHPGVILFEQFGQSSLDTRLNNWPVRRSDKLWVEVCKQA